MRLWHQKIIPYLNRQHILAQWREVVGILGNGWGKKHKTIDYAFQYSENRLITFALLVIDEMHKRGYKPNESLIQTALVERRNKTQEEFETLLKEAQLIYEENTIIYPEHNEEYLQECVKLLIEKGYPIDFYKK